MVVSPPLRCPPPRGLPRLPWSADSLATNIEDYVRSSAETRAAYDAHNRQQAGDPAKLGAALVTLVSTEKPPLHYAAGSNAVEGILGKITTMRNEIERWRELSVSTDLVVEKHCNREV